MDARMLVQSKFLVSEAFGIGDVPKEPLVTIADTKLEMQEEEGKKERWGLLYFKESWARPLKINRTHQRALILMFGEETTAWVGKQILLYAMAGTFFGKRQTAVRIRGSPQLKAAVSFTVKKFGGGSDTYRLETITPKGGFNPTVCLPWGKWKGRRYEDLSDDEINAALLEVATAMERPEVKKTPNAQWVLDGPPALLALGAEREKRLVAAVPDAGAAPVEPDAAPPEPGADG